MGEEPHIYKRHNKTLLLYHIVFPVKYRREAIKEGVGNTLKRVCIEIGKRYEINFVEIGADEDHIHFLVQSVPNISVSQIVRIIKSITAKQIFRAHPEVKKILWGGNFWTSGFYANTIGEYGNKEIVKEYIEKQGKKYIEIHKGQLALFEGIY